MLGALAAIALVAGMIGATVSVTNTDQQAVDQTREPVVTVQTIEAPDALSE